MSKSELAPLHPGKVHIAPVVELRGPRWLVVREVLRDLPVARPNQYVSRTRQMVFISRFSFGTRAVE